ncbi:MAG TPA: VanZ family protein [Burkholderiales bacterium]|jgi:VanZ family protein|nr:VanZ family protein [Burkholderiales bacterium]
MPRPAAGPPVPYAKSSKLVRYLAVAYLLLVAYTSLYPFTGWHRPDEEVRAFLASDWPRFLTWSDVALNALAYLPAGFLLTLILMPLMRRSLAAVAAAALAAGISLGFEFIQTYLPARIPSNVDLLCNAFGAALGALLAARFGGWVLSGELRRLREQWFAPGAQVDFCFLLLALWLITQLNAEIWLFGNGDVRHLLPDPPAVAYSAQTYLLLEAGVAGLNGAGVLLMLSAISRSLNAAAASSVILLLLALGLKSLASAALFVSGNPLLWFTPGSSAGLAIGAIAWLALIALPRPVQAAAAAACFALGMAIVNAAPENPYLTAALRVWQHGHYGVVNELTRGLSSAWSFIAIAYLAYAGYRLR